MDNKKSSCTLPLNQIILIFSLLIVLVGQVSAHGRMIDPPIRIRDGDENQGFTITNGPTKENPCAGNPQGPVKTRFQSGETISVKWKITAAHRGTCTIQLSTTGQDTDFKDIKKLSKCADENGDFSEDVKLPDVNCERCTLRFKWDAELTKELYLNCADISIGGGKNKRDAFRGNPGRIDFKNKRDAFRGNPGRIDFKNKRDAFRGNPGRIDFKDKRDAFRGNPGRIDFKNKRDAFRGNPGRIDFKNKRDAFRGNPGRIDFKNKRDAFRGNPGRIDFKKV